MKPNWKKLYVYNFDTEIAFSIEFWLRRPKTLEKDFSKRINYFNASSLSQPVPANSSE